MRHRVALSNSLPLLQLPKEQFFPLFELGFLEGLKFKSPNRFSTHGAEHLFLKS
jgi:hypothetical protein